jgi:hypothetical protein
VRGEEGERETQAMGLSYLSSVKASSREGKVRQETALMAERDVVIMSRAEISVAVKRRVCSFTGRRRQAMEVKVSKSRAVSD